MTKSLSRSLGVMLVGVAMIALWALSAPAISSAGHGDSQGRIYIVFAKASGDRNGFGRFEIGTEKRLRCRYLRRSKDRSLKWSFDDGRDGDFDLVGRFVCTKGSLLFYLRGTRPRNIYEPIQPNRPDRKSTVVRFSLDLEELRANHLSAVVKSRDHQSPGCTKPCRDRVPDSGYLRVY